jgi:phospholipid/cholesterol/gamma-HCH transport system ATP-binding protein
MGTEAVLNGHRTGTLGLRNSIEAALACGATSVNRLSYARTSVGFRIAGDGEQSVTVLLDRKPPRLAGADEPAEVEITLTPEQGVLFAEGALAIPAAVVAGEVETRGPVRKYLEVDSILGSLLARVHSDGLTDRDHRRERTARASGHGTGAVADLLAIETRDLHKSFGPNEVLSGVDLKVPEGVISVILGPSGTGKSVLLKHIIGLLSPDAGDVLIRGRPLSGMSRSQVLSLRREIGVMFQDGALFSTMNVFDNTAFPLRQHSDLNEGEIRDVVLERLSGVGLSDALDRLPAQLSGGMRKRAGLARALVLEPSIVLCDEPDSGLDPVRTALLGDVLVDQHAQYGGTMIVVTHNVALAQRISDHVSILWQGRVLESGLSEQVFASPTPFVKQFLAGDSVGPLTME